MSLYICSELTGLLTVTRITELIIWPLNNMEHADRLAINLQDPTGGVYEAIH